MCVYVCYKKKASLSLFPKVARRGGISLPENLLEKLTLLSPPPPSLSSRRYASSIYSPEHSDRRPPRERVRQMEIRDRERIPRLTARGSMAARAAPKIQGEYQIYLSISIVGNYRKFELKIINMLIILLLMLLYNNWNVAFKSFVEKSFFFSTKNTRYIRWQL